MKNNTYIKQISKGLSDSELILKYESGKTNLKKVLTPMLKKPKSLN
jgi:hypothetical protein